MAGRNPFLINVADLRRMAGSRKAVSVAAPLGELRVVDTAVDAAADVTVEVELESVDDGIVATGAASAPWTSVCRRCLGRAVGTTTVEVREVFSPNPIDEDIYRLEHDQVDLADMARDAVLLELPLAPLCRDDCEGLGSVTEEVAEAERAAEAPPADPRWGALEALRSRLPPQ
jgi:uncharacterized protein